MILDPRRALVVPPGLFFISNKRRDTITDRNESTVLPFFGIAPEVLTGW